MAHSASLENRLTSLFDGARSHLPLEQKWAVVLLVGATAASAVASLIHPVAVRAGDVANAEPSRPNRDSRRSLRERGATIADIGAIGDFFALHPTDAITLELSRNRALAANNSQSSKVRLHRRTTTK